MSSTICTLKSCCVVWRYTTQRDCDGIINESLCLAIVAPLCTCCVDNHPWLLWQQSKLICIVSAAHRQPLLVWSPAGLNTTQTHWKKTCLWWNFCQIKLFCFLDTFVTLSKWSVQRMALKASSVLFKRWTRIWQRFMFVVICISAVRKLNV